MKLSALLLLVPPLGLAILLLHKAPPEPLPAGIGKNPGVESPTDREQRLAFDEAYRQGRQAFSRGDLRAADARFTEALRIRPDDEFLLKDLADVYAAEGRRESVYVVYHKILRENPGVRSSVKRDPQLLERYGELCEARGDLQEARWAYAQAAYSGISELPPARVNPRSDDLPSLKAAALGRAGTTAAAHGKNEAAAALLQRAVRIDPQSWALRYHLGVALHNVGRIAEGDASLAKAESLAGRNAAFVRRQEGAHGRSRVLGIVGIVNGKAVQMPIPRP